MPRCTHLGCQKEYEESDNEEGSCSYHSGGPVRPLAEAQLLEGQAKDSADIIGLSRRTEVMVCVADII